MGALEVRAGGGAKTMQTGSLRQFLACYYNGLVIHPIPLPILGWRERGSAGTRRHARTSVRRDRRIGVAGKVGVGQQG
jgi:hypothetical protein